MFRIRQPPGRRLLTRYCPTARLAIETSIRMGTRQLSPPSSRCMPGIRLPCRSAMARNRCRDSTQTGGVPVRHSNTSATGRGGVGHVPDQHRGGLDGADRLSRQGRTGGSAWCCPPATRRTPSGAIVATIRDELMEGVALVDEVIVVDSGRPTRPPRWPRRPGRGWSPGRDDPRAAADGRQGRRAVEPGWPPPRRRRRLHRRRPAGVPPHFVTGLLGPLLTDPSVVFVKGFYHRPLVGAATSSRTAAAGSPSWSPARCSTCFWPELAGFVQPLAGEYAGRRDVLERMPFVSGYGVEIGHADRPARPGRTGRAGPGRPGRAQAPPPGHRGAGPDVGPDHADRLARLQRARLRRSPKRPPSTTADTVPPRRHRRPAAPGPGDHDHRRRRAGKTAAGRRSHRCPASPSSRSATCRAARRRR